MKLTTGILAMAMVTGSAWAQNPDVIQNTKDTRKAVELKKTLDTNAALSASQAQAAHQPNLPAASKPAPAKASLPGAGAKVVPAARQKAPAARMAPAKPAAKAAAAPAKPVAVVPKTAKAVIDVRSQGNASGPAEPKKDSDASATRGSRRDPFISPVVSRLGGSGCSTGKKCLDIEAIALKGVVKSDTGMIAVVTNELNKAYFLRENDPVFNGYVVKITGDSIVFKQTVQDRLGKSNQRDVVKKLTTPAV